MNACVAVRLTLGMATALLAGAAAHAAPQALDPASAEAFADELIRPAMAASGVPGAIVAIVRDDATLLAKGYGVFDLHAGTPVDPATTRFNLASIGKPMTALAALLLAHEGRLDLDRDVNGYLAGSGRDIRVTGEVATLNHLLGHRAGFDANISHLFVGLGDDASVGDDEINRRLTLLRKPGVANGYDNQGYGVVALVLGAVTGQPLPELLAQRVFEPIGMVHTRYVTPDDRDPQLAPCYVPRGPGVVRPCDYPVYREVVRGSGGVAASAHDMARFMRVVLNGGRIDGRQIVPADVIADLTDFSRYRFHPGLPGAARSFIEFNHTDRPEFAHSGHVPGFSSMMRFYPAARMGILVSFLGGVTQSFDAVPTAMLDYLLNYRPTPEAQNAIRDLENVTEVFRDRFVPTVDPAPVSLPAPPHTVAQPAGSYQLVAEQSASLAGRVAQLAQTAAVTAEPDGSIRFADVAYRPIAADLYENDAKDRIAFAARDGQVLMATMLSGAVWRKVSGLQAASWTVPAFLLGLLAWLSWLLYPWRGAIPATRGAARLALLSVLALLAGLFCELEYGVWFRIVQGHLLWPALWQALIVAALAGMLLAAFRGTRAAFEASDRSGWVRMLRRVHGVVLAAAALAMAASYAIW